MNKFSGNMWRGYNEVRIQVLRSHLLGFRRIVVQIKHKAFEDEDSHSNSHEATNP